MSQTINDHSRMVRELVKSGNEIAATLDARRINLLHMTVGVAGESGELLDAVKKHVIYNRELDVINVIEELGDLEFYMEGVRQVLGLHREEILQANINKLRERYGDEYTDEQAQLRRDKQDQSGLPPELAQSQMEQ